MKKKNNNVKLSLTKCPKCGYCNKNIFIEQYGVCNGCKYIINHKGYFKYTMIKKLHLFKKGQAGYKYQKNR